MNERPTPETDAARHDLSDYGSPVPCSYGDWIPVDVAKRLERERDEAREKWKEQNEALRTLAEHGENEIQKLIKERDEAREALEYIAHAGLSARHIEDYAKEFLRREEVVK